MLKRGSSLAAVLALIGGLLLISGSAVSAASATPQFTITADRASAVPADHRWAFNDFFPRTATIETGGTFQFASEGFHTATLLPLSWTAAADQDVNGIASADLDDPGLNANGTTKALENIPAVLPVPAQGCGTPDAPCVFDGSSIVSMGISLAGPPGPPAPLW